MAKSAASEQSPGAVAPQQFGISAGDLHAAEQQAANGAAYWQGKSGR